MNVEENRLETFSEWPANAPVDSARIAKAGFYYTGRAYEVQCFLCGTIVSEWNYGDQAMAKHRQAEPMCPFVQNPNETCNVPLVPSSGNNLPASASSMETAVSNASPLVQQAMALYRSQDPKKDFGTMSQRLRSFEKWPKSNIISPEKLAKSGFYYLQWQDAVECVYCGCMIMDWTVSTDLDRLHREFVPKCDFYLHQKEQDSLDLQNVVLRPGTTENRTQLGIQAHRAPKTPQYATYEERLRSFVHWPEALRQTPEMLARAGFYYAGFGDHVRCFYCDGGVRNWEATDDVWTEHARWFPECGYVNLVQGRDFVKHCIDNRPPLDPSIFEGFPEEENGDSQRTPVASVSSILPPTQEVTDATLERLLHSPPAMVALEIGLHVGRVKRALKQRIEQFGAPYQNADELIEAVLNAQAMEDDMSSDNPTPNSPSSELVNLLNHITTQQANNTAGQTSDFEDSNEISKTCDNSKGKECSSSKTNMEESDTSDLASVAGTKTVETTLLEEENRKLKEARLCKICMDWEVSVVFLPCGHLSTCVYCAPSLTDCPMCRQEIRAVVRTFVS